MSRALSARSLRRRAVLPAVFALSFAGLAGAGLPAAHATAPPVYGQGDVFASVGNGQVKEFTPSGTLVRTLDNGQGSSYTTGSAFDAAGNLLVTTFGDGLISKFDPQGNSAGTFASTAADGFGGEVESISLDQNGNAFVGAADTNVIREYDSGGTLINHWAVQLEDRGTDWVDLSGDQCTIHYTSEGTAVLSFNVCTATQNAPLTTTLPGSYAYELREIPGSGGQILVADSEMAVLIDGGGNVLRTYVPAGGASALFALNLDPDGASFWTADLTNGQIFRFRISDGTQLASFNGQPQTSVAGLSVFGERTAGQNNPPVVDAGPPVAGAVNTPLNLDGSVDDAEGDSLTINWTVDSSSCTFADVHDPTTTITCSDQGTFTATLGANDGQNPTQYGSTQVVVGDGTGTGPTCLGFTPTTGTTSSTDPNTGVTTITGTSGNDVILGTDGADVINGGDGNDIICAKRGNDVVHGGNGDDVIQGQAGDDSLYGDAGNDRVYGNEGADKVYGGTGDDTVKGGQGNDRVQGQAGNDKVYGGAGNDTIEGNDGADALLGGDGNDKVYGGMATDTCDGGAGTDTARTCETASNFP